MTSERVGPAFEDGVTWIEIGDKDREIGGSVATIFFSNVHLRIG